MITLFGTSLSSSTFVFVATVAAVAFLLWQIVLTFFVVKFHKKTNTVLGKTKRSDLSKMLNEHIKSVAEARSDVDSLTKELDELKKSSVFNVSKVGLIRFNPYGDTGGNQSFALSLLNERGDGIVLSSLHGRDRTRSYAKPVKRGEPADFELSEEEMLAVKKALEVKVEDEE